MTLDDPELTLNGHYAFFYITHVFRSPHKNMIEDRLTLSEAKMQKIKDRCF